MSKNQPENHLTEHPIPVPRTPESRKNIATGRRRFASMGLGVPVLLTLSSRSVLAGQCLSNMLSGNLSDPDRNSICGKGWSPGGWSSVGGLISNLSTVAAWDKIGFTYGTYDASACPGNSGNNNNNNNGGNSACYTGGSTVGFLRQASLGVLIKNSNISDSLPLRDLLGQDNGNYNPTRHYITAYFNALLSENHTVPTGRYVMTSQQVLDLANTVWSPPNGMEVTTFLNSTWT